MGGTVWTLDTGYAECSTVFQTHGASVSIDLTGPGNTSPTSDLTPTVATVARPLHHLSLWLGNAQTRATAFYNLSSALTAFGKSAAEDPVAG